MPENKHQPGFDLGGRAGWDQEKNIKTRKAAVISLAVLGVFIIGFSFFQFGNRIRDPFRVDGVSDGSNSTDLKNQYFQTLQSNDTDSDGLSDYDELNVYGTSPYLEDTDSDGKSDKDEIASGSNPTCPAGQDCTGASVASQENVSTTTDTAVSGSGELPSTTSTPSNEEKLLEGMASGDVDASVLRSILLANGFNEEDLSKVSDEDLKAVYIEAITEKTQKEASNQTVQ